MTELRAVGIDLGTTYSAVACLDESGRSSVVRNTEGQLLTPSVVFFDENEVVVGKAAKQVAGLEPHRVAECVKRDMGSEFYSRAINGRQIPPEVVQACILRRLKEDIQASIGSDFKAIITVPAYFDEPRRKATADAGEIAGLDVLDIVNEPTAAALAFGEQLGYLSPTGDPLQTMKVLVYDLGGGTFDVTIIHLAPGNIRTLATDGDVQLGGRDWDEALADYAAEVFQKSHGVDLRQDPMSLGKLMIAVEDAKHTLTQRDRVGIRVEHEGIVVDVPVSREQFEQMTEGLLERTSFTTRQMLAAANLSWRDIPRILMVGGSTRMPMVSAMIQQLSGIVPDRSINPDEAVARGAALFAGFQLSKRGAAPASQFNVTDVNAHSLGLQGIAEGTLQRENMIVIPKNTALPAKVKRQFVTQKPGQKSIVVQVLEGESTQPSLCSQIGRSIFRNLPPDLPQGYPIDVTFSYGTNGRLNVEAELSGSGRTVRIELEREQGLTSAQLQRWRQIIGSEVVGPTTEAVLAEILQLSGGATGPPSTPTPAANSAASSPASPAAPLASSQPATLASPDSAQPQPSGAATASGTAENPTVAATAATATTTPQAGEIKSTAAAATTAAERTAKAQKQRRIQRTILICGHVVFAALGLAAGYYILCWLKPEADILGIFGP
ncbi:MAG: Hsp70 family protein [Pirellulales bacterium]